MPFSGVAPSKLKIKKSRQAMCIQRNRLIPFSILVMGGGLQDPLPCLMRRENHHVYLLRWLQHQHWNRIARISGTIPNVIYPFVFRKDRPRTPRNVVATPLSTFEKQPNQVRVYTFSMVIRFDIFNLLVKVAILLPKNILIKLTRQTNRINYKKKCVKFNINIFFFVIFSLCPFF